jgi:hypothetical protein
LSYHVLYKRPKTFEGTSLHDVLVSVADDLQRNIEKLDQMSATYD